MELAETFATVARALLGEDDVEATLLKITTLGVETIDGCDHAGVSLVQGRKISTPAASDDIPGELRPDSQQYDLIAQALNDHLTDLGRDQPIPYSSSR